MYRNILLQVELKKLRNVNITYQELHRHFWFVSRKWSCIWWVREYWRPRAGSRDSASPRLDPVPTDSSRVHNPTQSTIYLIHKSWICIGLNAIWRIVLTDNVPELLIFCSVSKDVPIFRPAPGYINQMN